MVYLLHFDRPYEHARHFVGVARDARELEQLLENPAAASRSPLLRAAHAAGVRFEIGRTWQGSAQLVDTLRRQNNLKRCCDKCTAARGRVHL